MSKRAALLGTFAVLLAAVLLIACSGEQEADAPQPTPSSAERAERTERSASAAEPQAQESQSQAEPVQEAAEQQAEAVEEVAEEEQEEAPEEEPSDAVEAQVESGQEATLSLLPPNVLGDPAARVHIIHFGDFQ